MGVVFFIARLPLQYLDHQESDASPPMELLRLLFYAVDTCLVA